jgi:hypothetical protein
MKAFIFSTLVLLAIATCALAARAPEISKRADQLDAWVAHDLKAGVLTQQKADDYSQRISRIRTTVLSNWTLTPALRAVFRKELDTVDKDIRADEKAAAAKAAASASPATTP